MKMSTYEILISGYGGEVVMGRIPKEKYEYFQKKKIDISEYSNDWDAYSKVPEKFQPFPPGSWHECDDLAHNTNVEMSGLCFIEVRNQSGDLIWESNLDIETLGQLGIRVDDSKEVFVDDEYKGTVVFFGQTFEKGSFFTGMIDVEGSFDPKKLKFITINTNGWKTLYELEYDNKEIDNSHDTSTTGKSSTYKFLVSKGSVEPQSAHSVPESKLTSWYPRNTSPFHIGYYEIEYSNGQLGKHLAWWNGKSFLKDVGGTQKKLSREEIYINKILHWRGCKSKQ